ncbi:MAG TPA: tripartite tricarboxylate transporter substrate binding protein [Burkholderiales bacterium]|nr:tripartite tricarboxylate transporter substrate binding protein [Burkholderiales bacterium]
MVAVMRAAPFLALLAAAALPACAGATYPERPIRLVVPYPPGGGTDIFARIFARALAERLGQNVIVDNRSGGGTILGTEIVARAAPDGHTLLVNAAAFVINPLLHAKPPYDPGKDFAHVMQIAAVPNLLVANAQLPARSLKELIELARAQPGALSYGSTGVGTPGHLSGELLRTMAAIQITHVPYRGGGPLVPALISGEVKLSFVSLPAALPHVKAGRIRALGNASLKRSPAAPEVPAIAETLPGFDASNWQGLFAPARTPAAIVRRLNAELRAALESPEVAQQLAQNGFEPIGGTPEAFTKAIGAETAKWAAVIRASGARAE